MNRFRAFRIHSEGGKIAARFEEIGLDDLAPGEVVIRVTHSGINYKDALAATGAGKILRRYPLVGGIDLAGTVESSSDARFVPGAAVQPAVPSAMAVNASSPRGSGITQSPGTRASCA